MSKKQGEVIVETGMDNSKFVKGVNELKNIVERLTNSLGKSSNKIKQSFSQGFSSDGLEKVWGEFDNLSQKVNEYKERLKILKDEKGLGFGDSEYNHTYQQLVLAQQELINYKRNLERTAAEERTQIGILPSLANGFRMLGDSAAAVPGRLLNIAKSAPSAMLRGVAKAGMSAAKAVGQLALRMTGLPGLFKNLKNRSSGLGSSIFKLGNMFKLLVARMGMQAVINGVKQGFQNLSKYSSSANADISALMSALTQLKNSLASAFAPLLSVVSPILTSFINQLSAAISKVGQFIAAITGKSTFTQATAVQQNYAKSLNNTANAAKKAANSLYSFDELNVIDNKDSDSGSGSGGTVSPSEMFEEVPIESDVQSFADRLKAAFEAGDFYGLGAIIGQKLNEALESIEWTGIQEKARNIANNIATLINGFLETVDWNLVGSTIANGLNTIVYFLEEFVTTLHWESVGTAIYQTLNGFIATVDWGAIGNTIGTGLKGILTIIYTTLEGLDWKSLADGVYTFLTNVDWSGISSALFESIGSLIGGIIAFLIELITDFGTDLYDAYFSNGEDGIQGFLDGMWALLQDIGTWIYDHMINPLITGVKNALGIHSPSTVFRDIGIYLMQGFQNGIKSLVTPVLNTFSNLKTKILDIFNKLKTSVFGVINGLLSGIETMCNGVVSGVNKCIEALNGLSFTIPDWVPVFGGKSWSMSIPTLREVKLPRLATGTVVPKQAGEFAAILGDNNRETEVVSPLSTIRQALREELDSSERDVNVYIVAEGDEAGFMRYIKYSYDKESQRIGTDFTKVEPA